jgi:uncharacterized protein (DUF2249 family)
MDMSHVIDLAAPLDNILYLFQSLQIPSDSSESLEPTFHIETTLSIIQSLLLNYDSTMDALRRAREAVRKLDSRQTINRERISEWTSDTLKTLHEAKTSLISQHHRLGHDKSEREILKHRLEKCEREKKTSDNLVLAMVEKLNDAEEMLLIQDREKRKLQSTVNSLKTQISSIYKWKNHFYGTGIMKDEKPFPIEKSPRQRGIEYAEKQRAKEVIKRGRSVERHSATKPKSNRSRSKSKTKSSSTKRSTSRNNETRDSPTINRSERDLFNSLKNIKDRKSTEYSMMYPSQSILLSKLKTLDGEIAELAKNLLE